MKKRLLKIFLIVIISFPAIFFFTKSVKSFLNSHPSFKIKEIVTSYPSYAKASEGRQLFLSAEARRAKAEVTSPTYTKEEIKKILNIDEQTSIFSLNLKKASKRLEEKPEIKKAVIIRRFPDTLILSLIHI